MTDRETPSTRAPAEPEAVELDLRDHGNGRDTAAPSDPEPTSTEHETSGDLLSRRQAAERFGLDPGVLRRLEKLGRLTPSRRTPRGPVYYTVAELERVVSEPVSDADGPLWAMVEEARRAALDAQTRASAAEAEVKALREMVERLLSERDHASTAQQGETASDRARRWAAQWEQHEQEEQLLPQQQREEASPRGSWWSRKG